MTEIHDRPVEGATHMRRREFLATAGAALAASRLGWAADLPRDVTITRVVSFELECTRPKHIGKNAYRHDHGTKAHDRIVRIYTDAGVDGFATSWAGANECAAMLGKSPFDFFDPAQRRARGPFGRYTSPLWDLAGKLLGKPVYELLGGSVRERVPAYDGSIYFTDLRPEFLHNWRDEFRREIEASQARGHRAFKVKIGRGKLWMVREDGLRRDIEVAGMMRRIVGADATLALDANDGYDWADAKRFLEQVGDARFAFVEEICSDDSPGALTAVKELIRSHGWKTLIADGENKRRPAQMKPWLEAGAVDILQGDMNLFGFEDILAEAELARPYGAVIAPHNWGSLIGYYLQLHVGKAVENFLMAEEDPMSSPALIADGFELEEGASSVPATPGLGLALDESALADAACVHFDLKR